MATNGLVVMTPTSVDITGGGSETSTTNADGSVTFGSCETLSLNGVFTSDYDNYMVTIRFVSSTDIQLQFRLRLSGTDNSTASSYTNQYLAANGATVSGSRQTTNFGELGTLSSTQRSGQTIFFYGPSLTQPTAVRGVDSSGLSSAYMADRANTHNQSTSYDGVTFYPFSGNMTGLVTVFGFNQ